MNKNITDSPFIHSLNDLLANSDKYSGFTNPLFKDLAFPPGLYINSNKPSKLRCTTTCFECIDDSTYSKLLTLANADDKTKSNKKTKKTKKDEKNKKNKKDKKTRKR